MAMVLIALTGARVWNQKDGTQRPTGFWAEEFAVPHEVLSNAGEDITVATPGGVVPVPDQFSLSAQANNGDAEKAERFRAYLEKVQHLLDTPQRLEDIDPGAFDVVLVPGGHGPMQDLAVNADIARIHATMLPDE